MSFIRVLWSSFKLSKINESSRAKILWFEPLWLKKGHTENWTRIIGFKVQCANHYTIRPWWYLDQFIFFAYFCQLWYIFKLFIIIWIDGRDLLSRSRGGYFGIKLFIFSVPTLRYRHLHCPMEANSLFPYANCNKVIT